MTEHEGKSDETKLTPEQQHTGFVKLLNTSSEEMVQRGKSSLSDRERDWLRFVKLCFDQGDITAEMKLLNLIHELQGRGKELIRIDIAAQLQESFVSGPCQEYFLYDWEQNRARLEKLAGEDSRDFIKQSWFQVQFQQLGKTPEFSGTIFNKAISGEVEGLLCDSVIKKRFKDPDQVSKHGLNFMSEFKDSLPDYGIITRWWNYVREKSDGSS